MEDRMRRRPAVFLVLPWLALLALAPGPLAAGKRPITEQDLFRFVWIADPQISPDGSRVAFVRAHVNDKKEGYETEIWMVSTHGGTPVKWTSGPRDGSPRWSPDGDKAVPKRVTSGPYDEGPPAWSHDGTQIDFTSNRSQEPYYELPTSALYAVPAAGGEVARLVSMEGVVESFRFAPGGRQVAFVGAVTRPPRSYDQPQLFVSDAATGSRPRAVAPDLDRDVGSGIIGDQHAPRGGAESPPFWAADAGSVIAAVSDQGAANLRRFDVKSGRAQPVTAGGQEVSAWTTTPDGSRIVVLVSTPTRIGDLYLVGGDGKLARLTDVNQELFSGLDLSEPEEIRYTSFDGRKIEAWVQKPPDFDPRRKYPLILDIHGGPHAAYGYNFFHEFQTMAA